MIKPPHNLKPIHDSPGNLPTKTPPIIIQLTPTLLKIPSPQNPPKTHKQLNLLKIPTHSILY